MCASTKVPRRPKSGFLKGALESGSVLSRGVRGAQAYIAANKKFADRLVEFMAPEDDYVWVHDYHLMLLPTLLRKRFHTVRPPSVSIDHPSHPPPERERAVEACVRLLPRLASRDKGERCSINPGGVAAA